MLRRHTEFIKERQYLMNVSAATIHCTRAHSNGSN